MELLNLAIIFNDHNMMEEITSNINYKTDEKYLIQTLFKNNLSYPKLLESLSSFALMKYSQTKNLLTEFYILEGFKQNNCIDFIALDQFYKTNSESLTSQIYFHSIKVLIKAHIFSTNTESNKIYTEIQSSNYLFEKCSDLLKLLENKIKNDLNMEIEFNQNDNFIKIKIKRESKWDSSILNIECKNKILKIKENDQIKFMAELFSEIEENDIEYSLVQNNLILNLNLTKKIKSKIWNKLFVNEVIKKKENKNVLSELPAKNVIIRTNKSSLESNVKPISTFSVNRKNKNWDEILKEEEIQIEKNNELGEDATLKFFKEIYKNADEETKRAMMKSYMTSGGTVLSTNWNDVKTKDYEGKDRVEPRK